MMVTAELAALYRTASERPAFAQGDGLQPVVASATLLSQRPLYTPEDDEQHASRVDREHDAHPEIGPTRYDRRQADGQSDSDNPRGDRRKQTLPTLIDTRSKRARRRTDREETIDFEI